MLRADSVISYIDDLSCREWRNVNERRTQIEKQIHKHPQVLHALAGMVAGAEVPAEEEIRLQRHLAKQVPDVSVSVEQIVLVCFVETVPSIWPTKCWM